MQVSTISFEKATSVHRLKRLPDWFRNLRSLSNICGNKRGCQCVSLFAVPPPHHSKSCYLSSWYKLPRPIQACYKRAWEVHQPKEGNSTNAEVSCHFLYSSNYDTSDLCPTYLALLTRVFSENSIFTWLNGSKITNKHEVQSEGWSVYSKITWKKNSIQLGNLHLPVLQNSNDLPSVLSMI